MNDNGERDAMLKFIGNIFGQAKKIDSEVVESSANLTPISRNVAQVFEQQLRTPPQHHAYIPPTQEEVSLTGIIPPVQTQPLDHVSSTLPTEQQVPELVIPELAAPSAPPYQPIAQVDLSPIFQAIETRAPAPSVNYEGDFKLEVFRRLDTIYDKLKLIEQQIENGKPPPRKKRTAKPVSGRSPKSQ